MNIVISGLGIIGGSYAKAIKKYTSHTVIGINRSEKPLQLALECGAIDRVGTVEDLKTADMLILGTYPKAAVEFINKNGEYINKSCIVTDTCGIKNEICPQMTALSEKYGFTFVGTHPMAGKEVNGFSASDADLFKNASCIIVPCKAPQTAVDFVIDFARSIGFGQTPTVTPQVHDRMIAFTSQVPHALACAYVLSPLCKNHKGFSAGSYRDVSRVAKINAELWTELFLENKEPLTAELDTLIDNLSRLRNSIASGDSKSLYEQLQAGRNVKEELQE
ncbi:MAG: prephenate dehydrogenase [Acutalibacteraceae bacterium]|nr:prephenate dehydrogenase [Acutalibacteraceae bacterium]